MKRGAIEILVGALVLLIGFGFVQYAYSGKQVKTVTGYTVTARFGKVGTIQLGAPVKVAGITIGRVANMSLDKSSFQVVMDLTIQSDLKLPADTKASITTDGLLGGKYVKLVPGQSKDMLAANGKITNTKDALVLEDLVAKIVNLAIGGDEAPAQQ